MTPASDLYRVLFEQSPDAILVIDPETMLAVDCNDRALELLGYSREEFRSVRVVDYEVLESPEQVRSRMDSLNARERDEFQTLWRTKAGDLREILLSARQVSLGGKLFFHVVARDITAEKRAEQRLALLNFALDHVHVEVFLVDIRSRILYANDQARRVLDFSLPELQGMCMGDIDPDFQVEVWPRHVADMRRSGSRIFESRHRTRQGFCYPVEVTANYFEYGGEGYILGLARDIRQRRREEERLRLLNECFVGFGTEAAANINRITVVVGRLMEASCALYNRLQSGMLCSIGQWQTPPGYPAEDRPEGHLCHDVIREAAAAPLVIRDLERSPYAVSDPNVRRYGLKTYIGTPVFWSGEAVGSLCVVYDHDVAPNEADLSFLNLAAAAVAVEEARWRSAAVLSQREEFIRTILDSVDEGFLVIDRNFRIVTANKAYRSIIGLELADIVDRHCYEISHHAKRPCFEEGEDCAVKRAFKTGQPQVAIHHHRNSDGTTSHVETRAFPLRDEAGNITSAIETINDITTRQQLIAEQLKSQKLEAIGTLAGGIAHDFNNLLQGVFGYLSMARLNLDRKEAAAALLAQAEQALGQSINLTGQLLTFAKGGQPVITCLALQPIIENVARFALSGTRSDFRLVALQPPWAVAADGGQIAQVVQNLVINANEAMPDGGQVGIRLDNLDLAPGQNPHLPSGGRFVRVAVSDRGGGIPPALLERIFDPYFTTKQQGSGLGLATSYSIVKNHGGRIEVDSTPGEGSCFAIYLPACEGESLPVEVPEPWTETPPARILIMDDEEVVRLVALEMLGALGHKAAAAADGEGAVTLFRAAQAVGEPFDAVILDLTVKGGMGGEQTIAALRQLDPGVRAIVSSGYADSSVMAEFRDYGFAAALKKPYRIDLLQKTLHQVLGYEGSA
jgi:PAS domain S-box-containing protein